ncbi:MAG TPA: phasin family protein [Acetobacteraceae bacterium]|nr:phasin family protein [Acetobacteraceae bacterium]
MAIKTKTDEVAGAVQDSTPATMEAVSQTVAASYQQGAQGIQNGASRGIEQTVSALKDGMSQAAAGLESTQARVKEGMEKAMKTAEEFVAFGQGNLEALVKSGQVWAAGVQDLGKQVAATAQSSIEESVSTFKAISAAKSVKDAFDLQASFARSTLEKAISEASRLADASFKLTEQTVAPLTARMSLAVEKFAKPV